MLASIPAILAMAASPGGGGGSQASMLSTLLPLVVIFAIFYFLMIRPQKRHKEMLTALKKGDRVVTRGGMMGTIDAIAENVVTLEVANEVRIRFSRESISGVESANAGNQ